jgi:hypothetical protein
MAAVFVAFEIDPSSATAGRHNPIKVAANVRTSLIVRFAFGSDYLT